jgi:hypothetical protein
MTSLTKLVSHKTMPFFPEFNQIISPKTEPSTESSQLAIDEYLTKLGCLGGKPTSNAKAAVILSSFFCQAQRLKSRVERKGGTMLIGWPHDEAYWRVRSEIGYKIAKQVREALINHGWIEHKVNASINLHEGTGNCHGYLIADFVPSLADGLSFQSNDTLIFATKSSAKKTKVVDVAVDKRTKALWALWKKTPLTFGNEQMWVARRTFSNAELTKGGRF